MDMKCCVMEEAKEKQMQFHIFMESFFLLNYTQYLYRKYTKVVSDSLDPTVLSVWLLHVCDNCTGIRSELCVELEKCISNINVKNVCGKT